MMQALAAQPAGEAFLSWLYELCGINKSPLALTNGEIASKAVVYNLGRQDIWLEIRPYIPFDVLAKIETAEIMQAQKAFSEYFTAEENEHE